MADYQYEPRSIERRTYHGQEKQAFSADFALDATLERSRPDPSGKIGCASMDQLLILKTGSTIPSLLDRRGDFEDWIIAGMGAAPERVVVVNVVEGGELPAPERLSGVVVTGSPAMVSHREPWSEHAADWLRTAVSSETPVLGICYGHQLLAHAIGGRVGPNPLGLEIGTLEVRLTEHAADDALLGSFSSGLRVQASHSESVLELPSHARRLGSSVGDPNFAFSVGPAAWGIQFHPEFDSEIMRAYISARRPLIESEGIDADLRRSEVENCPDAAAVLRRFAQLLRT